MMTDATPLQNQFAELLRWEKQKRLRANFLVRYCCGFGCGGLLSPLHGFLPLRGLRWLVPVILTLGLAPGFFYHRRWRAVDATRTFVELDRKLALAERAVTAWELAGRSDRSAAAQLVFQQTEPHLRGLDPRRLFPRRWGWPCYAVGAAVAFLVCAPVVRLRSVVFPTELTSAKLGAAAARVCPGLSGKSQDRRAAPKFASSDRSWKNLPRRISPTRPTTSSSKTIWPA